MSLIESEFPAVIELNVGGVLHTTSLSTLTKDSGSLLGRMFTGREQIIRDAKGRYFLDRDGVLFKYILDYLRNQKLFLPKNFQEVNRLKSEAEFFKLRGMLSYMDKEALSSSTTSIGQPGCVTVLYRGKVCNDPRNKGVGVDEILISGHASLCREVFGDDLRVWSQLQNRILDPYAYGNPVPIQFKLLQYTENFSLDHNNLEMVFDNLQKAGFRYAFTTASGNDKQFYDNKFVFLRP